MIAAAVGANTAAAAPESSSTASNCSDQYFEVEMGAVPLKVHGQLCRPSSPAANGVLEVLVPGSTYNGGYWNSPVDDGRFSYVDYANRSGYATLAMDRVGTGASDHPLSALVTASGEAQVVHQVTDQMRAGHGSAPAFKRIVLVGHSLGSMIVAIAAATYRDEQAVILSGWSTSTQASELIKALVGRLMPATLDPALHVLDPGYLTTTPGSRERLFDAPADVSPDVVAWDEETKDTVAATEVPDALLLGQSEAELSRIDVPVLIANGSDDGFSCGGPIDCSSGASLVRSESGFFAPAARLAGTILPGSGHDNTLAANASQWYAAAVTWLRAIGLS